MNRYSAIFGIYVRMYVDHQFDAVSDEAATAQAIQEFKEHAREFIWIDADYDNLALPSIVGLHELETNRDIAEGHDFAACAADARDLASAELLACLKEILAEIDEEIRQRQTSGNAEKWDDLQQKSDHAHAVIRKAETVD
jgi:hypothetical protein